jgi:hypothetical protein
MTNIQKYVTLTAAKLGITESEALSRLHDQIEESRRSERRAADDKARAKARRFHGEGD